MKFKLDKNSESELRNIYEDYAKRHTDDVTSDKEEIMLRKADNEMYDVTLSSCVSVAKNFIRIPTEYYCGEKVYPRDIGFISDYSYYEKKCVYEILKEYESDLVKTISDYLKGELKYD